MNNKLTQFLRKDLQEKLESGKVNSLVVQTVALIHFAQQLGYKPVNSDIRKGFVSYDQFYGYKFKSLQVMQNLYNTGYPNPKRITKSGFTQADKIVYRISIQYHKRTTKQLTSELHWLKFLGKEE